MNTRAQCQEYVAAFRKYLPGMEHCRLVSSGYKLGIRDTRHLVGEHILTAEEVLGAVKQPDTIARGAWPCEMHNRHQPDGRLPLGSRMTATYEHSAPLSKIPQYRQSVGRRTSGQR